MSFPTIVIVPAACQRLAHNRTFATKKSQLHRSRDSPSLRRCVTGSQEVRRNVIAIREAASSLVEDGDEVIMLLHSYGDSPDSAAMKGRGAKGSVKDGKIGWYEEARIPVELLERRGNDLGSQALTHRHYQGRYNHSLQRGCLQRLILPFPSRGRRARGHVTRTALCGCYEERADIRSVRGHPIHVRRMHA